MQQGTKHKSPFVILGLLVKYGVGEAVLTTVSKLMLPKHVWSPKNQFPGCSWAVDLRQRLAVPKVLAVVDVVWANRFSPQYGRVTRKGKRLFAESKVFQQVMAMNERGVSPKREQLITWFKEAWLYTDVGTDAFPTSLDQPRKCRRWMEKFKSFWQVNWGKLAVRGQLTPEQQGHKVRNRWDLARNQSWFHVLNHFLASDLGSRWCEINNEFQKW